MMDGYLVRLDLLHRKAESKIKTGWVFPQVLAPALCMQNASLSRSEKSLVLACVPGNSGVSAVARQMRPLFGSRGGAIREDFSAATDVEVISNDESDFAPWLAYNKAKNKKERKTATAGRKKRKLK